jgi:hypothetical protein
MELVWHPGTQNPSLTFMADNGNSKSCSGREEFKKKSLMADSNTYDAHSSWLWY